LDKRQKRSRKRGDEDQGDITWINEKNRMFNKKLSRYYDEVTKETRDNFERGELIIVSNHFFLSRRFEHERLMRFLGMPHRYCFVEEELQYLFLSLSPIVYNSRTPSSLYTSRKTLDLYCTYFVAKERRTSD